MAFSKNAAVLQVQPHGGAQFVSATVLPLRGMTVYQLKAWIPGRGLVELLVPPEGPANVAGGLLIPFANRLRGALSPDEQTIETRILNRVVRMPANCGSSPAERAAIHGFVFNMPFEQVNVTSTQQESVLTASLDAADFGGRWLSRTALSIRITLRPDVFALQVRATNSGPDELPIGIGWHPNFRCPSGKRSQVRLHIAAGKRVVVNNYRACFPTGEVTGLSGSEYDFSAPSGRPLGNLSLDDCFVDLERNAEGHAVAEMFDPAAGWGVRVKALSAAIKAFQIYAPKRRQLVAIEPQFNRADPFSPIWGIENNGIVLLPPGESIDYEVEAALHGLA